MRRDWVKQFVRHFDDLLIWGIFLLGVGLAVIKPMGLGMTLVPGNLVDNRFNNYVLEHFFRWLSGLDKDFWNATFFYPFPLTIAFSDNLLGSAFIYGLLRGAGLDMSTAFQGWYIFGFCLNYVASTFALSRLKLKPLGIAVGAFFFTFGLPILAQEIHAQLLYRFGVPLTCYFLVSFYEEPQLRKLLAVIFWLAWQFYLTIYVGIFLVLLLVALAFWLPFSFPAISFWDRLAAWPKRLRQAWLQASVLERILFMAAGLVMFACLAALLWPYFRVTRLYGFSREWKSVSSMLPQPQSYIVNEKAILWNSLAGPFVNPLLSNLNAVSLVQEHQLFPGIAVVITLLAGLVALRSADNHRVAWLCFWAALTLVVLTLRVNDFSLYQYISHIPGINGIRAVTRIELVVMWPISIFLASTVDALRTKSSGEFPWPVVAAYFLAGLMVVESTLFFSHTAFPKAVAEARLDGLRQQLPDSVPYQPILFVGPDKTSPPRYVDIDVMLVAQERGWSTMNGYSGNFPPGYRSTNRCNQLPIALEYYMMFAGVSNQVSLYQGLMERVVLINFQNCNPGWWKKMP